LFQNNQTSSSGYFKVIKMEIWNVTNNMVNVKWNVIFVHSQVIYSRSHIRLGHWCEDNAIRASNKNQKLKFNVLIILSTKWKKIKLLNCAVNLLYWAIYNLKPYLGYFILSVENLRYVANEIFGLYSIGTGVIDMSKYKH
jgi:hypothetical protein